MCEEISHGRLCLACFIDVETGDGKPLSRLHFEDAVTITGV